jgi:hypothetical protein
MAAATVTLRRQNDVLGRLRNVSAGSIVFASNGDTWAVPGIKNIYAINLTPTAGTAFGFTRSGNTITLVAAGGLTFSGSVLGL